MWVAVRAFISVVMLAGFYVLALVQLVVGLAFAVWIASLTTGAIGAKIGLAVFLATGWAVGYGTWKALRIKPGPPPGLPIDRAAAPDLWSTVDELAKMVGTRAPDAIYLLPEVNAAVSERSRLMGLIGGRRDMFIGMPLLQTLSVAQLRAVLAHELGHYSGKHLKFAGISMRGREALARTINHLSAGNIAGLVFRGYGRLYVRVQNGVSRKQELEADRAAVRAAGREAAASALRDLDVLDAAFTFYLNRYVGPGLNAGYAPDDLFAGFAEMLDARADELAALRADHQPDQDEKPSIWNTHPPTGVRVAAIMMAPETAAPVDNQPAQVLLPDAAAAGRALQGRLLDAEKLTVLPWEQFLASAASSRLQENLDGVLRSISRSVDQPVPDVGAILDLIAAGRLDDIAAPIYPNATRREARKRFVEVVVALFNLAAVRSGVARWQHSWAGRPTLVDNDGTDLDLTSIAELAVDPATIDDARRQLADRGIDVTAARHVRQKQTAERAEIYAGVANMRVNKRRTDVLVLSNGLMLVPGVARYKASTAKRRIANWLQEGDPTAPAAVEGARFIPYEEIVAASLTHKLPVTYEVSLYHGEKVEIRRGFETEEVGNGDEVLAQAMQSMSSDAVA